MKPRPEIDQKVQQTLDSLDNIRKAEPNPYFYTRVMARLQRESRTIWETMGAILNRPAVAIASLCLILVINGIFLLRQDEANSGNTAGMVSGQLVTDNEYIIASSSSYDYENLDAQ